MNRRHSQLTANKRPGDGAKAKDARRPPAQLAEVAGRVGRALIGLLLVLVVLIPGDSVAVEQGDALLLVWPPLLAAICAVLVFRASGVEARRTALLACGCWIGLAAWMWVSVLANLADANVRAAINESWYWTAAAATFIAAAILFQNDAQRRTLVALFFAVLVAASFHAAYQYVVTMPRDLELLSVDPDEALRRAGVDPTTDPVTRRMFIDRLAGREPIATFALTNSLAGLLAPGVVLAIAIVVLSISQRSGGWRAWLLWIAVALFAGVVLLVTKSRSAWLAVMFGFVLIPVGSILVHSTRLNRWFRLRASGAAEDRSQEAPAGERAQQGREGGAVTTPLVRSRTALLVVIAGVLLLAGAVALVANDRLVLSGAPQSVRVRLDYWRAAIAMVIDRPLVGFAPGNFQPAYPAYRLPSAHEQIADPHNFLLELAALGGIPAAVLFLAAAVFGAAGLLRRRSPTSAEDGSEPERSGRADPVDWNVTVGSLVALPTAWIGGYILGVAPDPEPYVTGIPLAAAVFVMGRAWVRRGALPRWALGIAAATLFAHLCTSGGVSVPGVLLPIVLLAGANLELWRPVRLRRRGRIRPRPKRIATSALVALTVVTGLFLISAWLPVRGVQQSVADAEVLARQGKIEQAIQVLQSGAAVDPFDPTVAAFAASLRGSWDLRYGGEWTAVLQQLVESLIERDPRNPAVYTQAADQRVLFYQRTGDGDHLRSASELYRAALERFPAGIRIRVQLALLERAMGDHRQARQYAEEAARLVEQMPFFDASLEAIPVLDPVSAPAADQSDSRISVRQALANLQ